MRRPPYAEGHAVAVQHGPRPKGLSGARARIRPRRWPIAAVRALATLFAAGVIAQAALAGRFVTGDVNLLKVHGALGGALILVPMLSVPAALSLWWFGRGPLWYVAFPLGLFALTGAQIGAGHGRNLALHIPLGVSLFGLTVGQMIWAYGYRRHLADETPDHGAPRTLPASAARGEVAR
ncbi:hypothetical protein M8Z33_03605 [Streptomyces sp. ZAF1911]|uniref:hypothetical protein n=1 Tax=Streptomyces sp. ZAF1911 TaxID=2944129 RepID=UPI00237B5729|nr:hypothetical protein [Streptomyces sp. ZAF1911]MDD9375773.1 hypothetical protein [Streptomyces sp. ZAF1911]